MSLSNKMTPERAARLRLLVFDVDGVMTDGSIVIQADESESKVFFVRDGAAIKWAQQEGLEVGLLSGRKSPATARRAAELGISIVVQGADNKAMAFDRILLSRGVSREETAYMGDDLQDLAVLAQAGVSAAPADAAEDVRARVDWVSRHAGGRGAVRDFIEAILRARGRWDAVVEGHLSS